MFNQKTYEQYIQMIRDGKLMMYSLDFYDYQLLQRERLHFVNPELYYKINPEYKKGLRYKEEKGLTKRKIR
jgi:hypothetical protein